jgi:hypothetical protein
MMGGVIAGGALTNRSTVIASMESQIRDFACWYLVNRLRQTSRLSLTTLEAASTHINGAARETAEVLVDALDYCLSHPGSGIQARGSGPAPNPAGTASGSCLLAVQGMRAAEAAERGARELERGAEDLYRRFRGLF